MATTTANSSATPPSPQEISRKLSLYSAAKKATLPTALNASSPPSASAISSLNTGAESDSDASDIISPPTGGLGHHSMQATGQLDAIVERNAASDDDESESDDGGASLHHLSDAPGTGDEIVFKSGYLWKKGERRKTWKKRWFVLRPHGLSLYKNSAEYQLLRLVDLSQIHSATPVNLKRHDHAFGLVSPSRTFYLQASTDAEANDWIQAIEAAKRPSTASAPISIPARQSDAPPTLAVTPSPPSFGFQHHGGASSASESDDNAYAPTSKPSQTASSPSQSRTSGGGGSSGSAAQSAKEPIMQGYLMKCGSKRKIWRKRWFVLNNSALVYYSSHMSNKAHRTIALRDLLDAFEYELSSAKHQPPSQVGHTQSKEPSSPTTPAPPSFTPASSSDPNAGPGKLTFKIVCTKRALLLCAPQEDDELKWIGAIRALVARRQQVPNTPSVATKETDLHSQESQDVLGQNQGAPVVGRRKLSVSSKSGALAATAEAREE